jgi:hypothetical protein
MLYKNISIMAVKNVELGEDKSQESEDIRFSVSFTMKRKLYEEMKGYAKSRRIPITSFTYQIILDYSKRNPKEIY